MIFTGTIDSGLVAMSYDVKKKELLLVKGEN
jgi:hypothetical protein